MSSESFDERVRRVFQDMETSKERMEYAMKQLSELGKERKLPDWAFKTTAQWTTEINATLDKLSRRPKWPT